MERKEWQAEYSLFRGRFPENYEVLCRAAIGAIAGAYSIYSGFSVGAAVWLNNGEIVCGSNQENLAYPSGLCAERVALFHACASFPETGIKAMAVAARREDGSLADLVTPCGACRQVMAEVIRRYGADFDVILVGRETSMLLRAGDLLPFAFGM